MDLAITVIMHTRFIILASLLGVTACVSPPPSPPLPPAATMPPLKVAAPPRPVVQPSGDWTEWPLSAGDWVYRQDERGSIALFGPSGADALVTLRCDRTRQRIYLSRAGSGSGSIVIRSSSTLNEFAGTPTAGTVPYIAAEIAPRDPVLDAMIFSRGRIAIEVTGQTPLAIPSWAEIGRVVEDCRV